ncbi:hypothetical protein SNOG_02986 [Parastagonospora nodorum SN15]|uniref:Uncharacterized protein n=1 Tax=Phaeosphaeria nodorum (strain SN15 / ATCC MYA-4574 / FGSC 10173) TaxID=321614 RepID=Q0UZ28_PHANO|nr:hypothetical protein SNOG_02986 [Parastagonospora nodorum SN15]EAT89717.1 hypothetical protein SNOG_02986 [Parastagonospora nodorum SN15]
MDTNVRGQHQNLARDASIDMIVRRVIAIMKTIPEKWWLEGDFQGFVGKLAKRQYHE